MVSLEYLRQQKGKQLQSWYDKTIHESSEPDCKVYHHATILPLRQNSSSALAWGEGGVFDSSGQYIKESSIQGYYDFGYPLTSKPEYHNETVVYCGYLRHHWGHFLVDCTNRLWYFLKHNNTIDRYVYFVEENASIELVGPYREFFEYLGIYDKLSIINKPITYNTIYIPQSSFCRQENSVFTNEYLSIFDRIAESIDTNLHSNLNLIKHEKVFFTRSKLTKAAQMELGMEAIDSFFENNGYKVLSPEKLSLLEQIFFIRNASTVACYSGTLPHNMLFARNGQRLEIIERNALNNNTQPWISNMRKLDVVHIDGNFSIYPVELAYGPFIYGFSKQLQRFAEDMHYQLPSNQYLSQAYYKSLFKKYIDKYENEYYMQWYMGGYSSWMVRDADLLYEAYQESETVFGDYLRGNTAYKRTQLLERRFLRSIIKKLLQKLSLKVSDTFYTKEKNALR